MKKNYFQSNPIKDWTIAKDVEHIFLNTIEKKERWQAIKAKNQPVQLVSTRCICTQNTNPFKTKNR